jgi:serine/threonine-protein kinase haspin
MPRQGAVRQYGKTSKRSTAERMFSELPQTPMRKQKHNATTEDDPVDCITDQLSSVQIEDSPKPRRTSPRKSVHRKSLLTGTVQPVAAEDAQPRPKAVSKDAQPSVGRQNIIPKQELQIVPGGETSLRVISWDEVCPPGDRIVKIAEASYAEVYRVSNERGTSIIKVIRLDSPIKALTKHQIKARLVDELPHSEEDLRGELQISEWLADIPGFVVYKERYIVQGKATRELLDTHQAFQSRIKRKDPGRAQFYPSPSRYLKDTQFLVVELGDAGTPLEDWEIENEDEMWDIFFLEAIALARAEDLAMFEVSISDSREYTCKGRADLI